MSPGATTIVRCGLLAVAVTGVSGCFTTTADYRQEAETFIVEEVTIADHPTAANGFVSASCDEPADQQPGTTFDCTAVDAGAATWEFEVEIEDGNRFEVRVSASP